MVLSFRIFRDGFRGRILRSRSKVDFWYLLLRERIYGVDIIIFRKYFRVIKLSFIIFVDEFNVILRYFWDNVLNCKSFGENFSVII